MRVVTLFFVLGCIVTSVTKAEGLANEVFWDNDWPSDLVDGGLSGSDDGFEFPSNGLENPNIISGLSNLNTIKDAEGLADVFNRTLNQEVEVRIQNGAWVGDLYLPDETQVKTKSKFQLTVSSSWKVTVHYNGGISVDVNNGETLILALIQGAWLDEDGYNAIATNSPTSSPTSSDERETNLLSGTVLFAQSQIIPSKHRHEGDKQPHLVSLRKTLVMLKLKDFADSEEMAIKMTVKDQDGNILVDNPIQMQTPENIPKHDSFIEGVSDADDIVFPSNLDDPHVIQHQSNLNAIGNDKDAVKLRAILNDIDKEVEIKTWDGSWVRDIYFPEGSTVPPGSKIQISCDSGYSVYIHYPVDGGGWRSKAYSRGDTEISILDNGIWLSKNALEHNKYIFGHGFYTAVLDKEWVQAGMTLEFFTREDIDENDYEEYVGVLNDIKIGAPTELMITLLDAGFLTPPRNEFTFKDDITTHREYFETSPISRLIVVEYETMHLTEIMLPDGTLYTTVSATDGGWHSGDMRGSIGKLLLSHGIDLANYGINSSQADSESPHPFTCALLAAHNTVGNYQNGRIVHGGSGGNGMVTLDSSVGNEFSHEVGHNYGLGHYVDGFKGSVHRPASEINSSWGWDSETNRFTPNFSQIDSGNDRCLEGECQSPYLEKYQFGTDSMAGGDPNYSNRFTFYTPNTARIIQNFMENKAVWSETSSTGFRKYNKSTKQMEEFTNNDNDNRVPSKYGVPVTTIVGFYDPDLNRGLSSYIYPALHGAYGFVYDGDGDAGSDAGCKLVVETRSTDTPLVYSLSDSALSSTMNKFHVNIATEDEPYEAAIYCEGKLLDSHNLDEPKAALEYTVTGVPITKPSVEPSSKPSLVPSSSPSSVPSAIPSSTPSSIPSSIPSLTPSSVPSVEPSSKPSLVPTCIDDHDFREMGKEKKNCNWVNKNKCKNMSKEAKEACPIACQNEDKCDLPKCWKNKDWKPNKKTSEFKNCKSIKDMTKKEKKNACAAQGKDKKTYGYEACKFCKKCSK